MKTTLVIRRCVVTALVAVLAIQGFLVAFAQSGGVRDAGSKIRADYLSRHTAASRNLRNSRNISRDFRTYARNTQRTKQTVTPAIAQAHAEELGQSIKLTQKHLAEERKLAEGDKSVIAALDQVNKYVAQEVAAQAKMTEECKGDKVDSQAAVTCCEDAELALEKAIELHDEIAMKLEDSK